MSFGPFFENLIPSLRKKSAFARYVQCPMLFLFVAGATEIIQLITKGFEQMRIESDFNGNGYVMLLVRMRRLKIVNMLIISQDLMIFCFGLLKCTLLWFIYFKYYVSKFIFMCKRLSIIECLVYWSGLSGSWQRYGQCTLSSHHI